MCPVICPCLRFYSYPWGGSNFHLYKLQLHFLYRRYFPPTIITLIAPKKIPQLYRYMHIQFLLFIIFVLPILHLYLIPGLQKLKYTWFAELYYLNYFMDISLLAMQNYFGLILYLHSIIVDYLIIFGAKSILIKLCKILN